MSTDTVSVDVILHGFPDLGLPGGSRQRTSLPMAPRDLCGRAICRALLDRFGAPLMPALGAAREPDGCLKNLHLFVNDVAIHDIDERLGDRVGETRRIDVLLILLRAIAGG